MIGSLHPDEIEEVLFRHQIGHLACIADGKPYLVPITYTYDGGALYGQTLPGRKLTALRSDPAICFAVAEHTDPDVWRSVVADGVFEEITEESDRSAALARLARAIPIVNKGNDSIVFRLRLTEKGGRWLRTELRGRGQERRSNPDNERSRTPSEHEEDA
jgi:uncharacterized protein